MDKLRFTPTAWAKLIYLRDYGKTEVSFYALTHPTDISLVIDVCMVPQRCSAGWTEFDNNGVADYFYKRTVEDGMQIEQFGRIWCHTHPGYSATPSGQDEKTFKEQFGNNHWAIMFIIAKPNKGETDITCRLRYQIAPLSEHFKKKEIVVDIDVDIDWEADFPASDFASWEEEYHKNWSEIKYTAPQTPQKKEWSTINSGGSLWIPGPGWRIDPITGRWKLYHLLQIEDNQKGILVSPDYRKQVSILGDTFRKPTEAGKSQGFLNYREPIRPLTKREQKYLKKHGSLAGFVPPRQYVDQGLIQGQMQIPQQQESQMVSLQKVEHQKLETSRNLLDFDDNSPRQDSEDWLHEVAEAQLIDDFSLEKKSYTVTLNKDLPTKYAGMRIKGVWATSGLEAMEIVYKKLGLPFQGSFTVDGEKVYIPGPEDIESTDEPSDEELTLLEDETELEETDILAELTPSEKIELQKALERDKVLWNDNHTRLNLYEPPDAPLPLT